VKRNQKGQFRPLVGAGGKNKWRIYKEASVLKDLGPAGNFALPTLLLELAPLTEIRCSACDGWGHIAKKCHTYKRLADIKKSATLGAILTRVMADIVYASKSSDVGVLTFARYLKPQKYHAGDYYKSAHL
jgi:hypothetical protein